MNFLLAGGGLLALAALVFLATPSSAHHTWYWTQEDAINDVTVGGPVRLGFSDELPEPLRELLNSETTHYVNLQYNWQSNKASCESMTWDAEGTSSFSSTSDPEDEGAAFAGHWIFDHRGYWTAGDNTGEHNGEKETVPYELTYWTYMGISFTGTYSVSWDDWSIGTTTITTIHLDLEGYSDDGLYMSYSGSGEGGIYRSMESGPEPPDQCDTNGGGSLEPLDCPDAVCETAPCDLGLCDPPPPCEDDCDPGLCDVAPCDYDPCENTGLCDPCGIIDCDGGPCDLAPCGFDPCAGGRCDLPECGEECDPPCTGSGRRESKSGSELDSKPLLNLEAVVDPPIECETDAD